ncbi:hypothetical protein [Pseudomonas nabeulensis]|uniref:hypothetical protein n=1 Tax=Pseudomonas nabeulensis TaxID=2293833 RepID=UPI0010761C1A|nr:hypothetical protein [Pseudomonas nabeulensis]
MNMTLPNYEILNFDSGSLVVPEVHNARIYPRPLIELLRQLQLADVMTKAELDEALFGIVPSASVTTTSS